MSEEEKIDKYRRKFNDAIEAAEEAFAFLEGAVTNDHDMNDVIIESGFPDLSRRVMSSTEFF